MDRGRALDDLVIGLLDRIRRKEFSISVPGDKTRWVKGWGENLDEFVASKGDLDALTPKYVRPNMPVRLYRRLAQPVEPQFEPNWRRVYQQWLFRTYFADCEQIYEFGCGSGGHVSVLAQMFPDKKIVGSRLGGALLRDRQQHAQAARLEHRGAPVRFLQTRLRHRNSPRQRRHDLCRARAGFGSFGAFIDFLLAKRPKLCVFVEPIYEWYDPANFIDHLAMRGHDIRNFLKGMPGALHRLQQDGRIEILKEHRVEFGSLLHEAYSQMIWRPV